MRRPIQTLCVAAAICALGCREAEAISNYSEWSKLDTAERAAYALALWEGQFVIFRDLYSEAHAVGLNRCGQEIRITNQLIARAISTFYEKDVGNWDKPPLLAFNEEFTRGLCKKQINEERSKRGIALVP
jgi:hypothetical protein